MAEIIYKPHCSACGALITEEVSYMSSIRTLSDYRYPCGIRPYRCSKCGKRFSSISIKNPTEILPEMESEG